MSCNAKKDPNGTWRIQYRWTDWTGTKKKSQKRGFKTKKEAEEWYAHFMLQQSSDPTMTLADFWEIHWYLEKNYGLKNDRNINKAMNIVASENKYHPIRDCLEKLKWDRLSRIDNLLSRYLGADHDDYTKEIMRLLMLAAIRRVYEPGCKFEIMVCLVGGQGAGKSTFFRFLAINDEWFSDDLKRMDDDNVYRKMQGHWII